MRRLIPVFAAIIFASAVLLMQRHTNDSVPIPEPATEVTAPVPAQPLLGITPMPPEPEPAFDFKRPVKPARKPLATVTPAPVLGAGLPAVSRAGTAGHCEPYIKQITHMAQEVFGLDAPVARFTAQLEQESKCERGAISGAGARGIAQMMPATANLLAQRYPELRPVDVHDPNWSIRAQLYLMRDLLDQYQGAVSVCDQWQFAWSAYNGGQRALGDEQRSAPNALQWVDSVQPQKSYRRSAANWRENRGYVQSIPIREARLIKSGVYGQSVCL